MLERRRLVILLGLVCIFTRIVSGQRSYWSSECPTSGIPPCVDSWSGIVLPADTACGPDEYCIPYDPTPAPTPSPNNISPPPSPSPGESPIPGSPSPDPVNDTSPSPNPEHSPEPSRSPDPPPSPAPEPPSRQGLKDALDAVKVSRGQTNRPHKQRQAGRPDNKSSGLSSLIVHMSGRRLQQQQWQQQQLWMQHEQRRQLRAVVGRQLMAVQQDGNRKVCHYKLKKAGFFCYNPSKCSIASLYNTCNGTSIDCQTAMVPNCVDGP